MSVSASSRQSARRSGALPGPQSSDPLSKHLEWLGRQQAEVSQHEILAIAVQHGGRRPLLRVSEASRRAQAAVEEFMASGGKRTNPPTAELAIRLTDHGQAVDMLRRHCLAWDGIRTFLAAWRGLSQRLLDQTEIKYDELQELASVAERWVEDCHGLPPEGIWAVVRGLCQVPASAADRELWQELAEDAVQAAWLIQKTLRPAWEWHRERQSALLAALFRDVGRLALAPHLANGARRGPEPLATLKSAHPRVSAAMLGIVSGAPSPFTQTVGFHHEHLDGSGPFRVSAERLSPAARFVAVIARVIELHRSRGSNSRVTIGGLLQTEANRDWWDASSVALLGFSEDDGELEKALASFAVQDQTATSYELHGEHSQPPETHLGRAPRPANAWHETLPPASFHQ